MRSHETQIVTVGVDGSPSAGRALQWGASFAKRSGAAVRAVLTWRYPLGAMPGTWGAAPPAAEMHDIGERILDEAVDGALGEACAERVVRQGRASSWLIDESTDASLLVVGRRGSGGLKRLGLGSTSQQCALHAEVPVAVIGDGVEPLPADPTVLVAVDGSDHSIEALVWAMRNLGGGSPIMAVYSHDEWVLDDVPEESELAAQFQRKAQDRLADVAAEARTQTGGGSLATLTYLEVCVAGAPLAAAVVGRSEPEVRIELQVVHGDPRTTVWDVARDLEADVVVVGAQGRTGLSGAILGSFTTHATHDCPEDMTLIVVR